jgi:hypothetical protein
VTTGGQGYGYTTPGNAIGNFGGTAPVKSAYGLTGNGPKKTSKVRMMMAGAAVAGVGLLGGVGGYYAYQRMKENDWGADAKDQSWCQNPSNRQMRCNDCFQAYGSSSCKNLNGCYDSKQGCAFELDKDTARDDLMDTGFIPMDYKAPYIVTITKIEGPDFLAAGICPQPVPATITGSSGSNVSADWAAKASFDDSLFVTLTEMDTLDSSAKKCLTKTAFDCPATLCASKANTKCVEGWCTCKPNFCLNAAGACTYKVGASSAFSNGAPWTTIGVLLLPLLWLRMRH